MSTYNITYVIAGIKFGYDEFDALLETKGEFEDHFDLDDDLQDKGSDIKVIVDGMCGEYTVVGKVLAEFDMYGEGDFTEIDCDTINFKSIKDQIDTIVECDKKVSLFTFVHSI